jgi:outer membrane receptor for ferrienterochelin and colicins
VASLVCHIPTARLTVLSAALMGLSFVNAAQADETLREKTLNQVVVTDQRDAQVERKESVIQKIVIAEEEVERFGDATVGDVLRRLPGMSVSGPAGVSKDIRMRGLDKGYTQFLINGEPVPGAVQERQMQVDRLPADMIERIEIIRNPSAEYDAHGIGGTINIVLKNKIDNVTRLRAAYGKNGDLDVGDVVGQWNRRFGDVDVLFAASHTVGAEDVTEDKDVLNSSLAVSSREFKAKPVKKTETLLTPRVIWHFGADRLTLDPYISAGTEDKRERTETRSAAGALTKEAANNEDKKDQLARFGGRYDGTTSWGNWYAKAAVQQGTSDKDKYAPTRDLSKAANKQWTLAKEREEITEDQVFVGAGVAVPLGDHLLKAGVEQRESEYEKSKQAWEGKEKASLALATAALAPKATGQNDIYNIKETKQIVYLQDEWHVAERHWLTPGVRYEKVTREATDRLGNQRDGTDESPNPSLHYRWALMSDLNLRASAAQTVKFPKFDDVNPLIVTTTSNTESTPDKAGNADLRPEKAAGLEIGLEKYFWNNSGVAGINFYNRDVKDYIEKATRLEDGRYVQRPYNVGEAHFWGAEFDARIPLLSKGPHLLTLLGSHAELRGRVTKASTGTVQDAKDMPPRVTNIGLNWTHRPTKWSAGFNLNHVPEFTTDTDNDDGAREVKTFKAMDTLDVYITKVFGPMAELRLVAKNVLSVSKQEDKIKYNANGTIKDGESKIERSQPTIFLTFESRF